MFQPDFDFNYMWKL